MDKKIDKRIKILHISTSDIQGGAAKAAYRLHKSLNTSDIINSKMIVAEKSSKDSNIIEVKKGFFLTYFLSRLEKKYFSIIRASKKNEQGKYFWPPGIFKKYSFTQILQSLPFKPDVIIAHWINNFFTCEDLHKLSDYTKAPIIWYLMDMAPMTGGCHYAFNCKGYKSECGRCPALDSNKKYDLSYKILKNKHEFIQKTNITAVVGSSYTFQQAKQSKIFSGKVIEQILLGLDEKIYKPDVRKIARQKLNIPDEKKIILFGSQSINEKRKGYKYFVEALNILKGLLGDRPELLHDIVIIIAGAKSAGNLKLPFPVYYLGILKEDEDLALAYQASDVYVSSSVEDSGPMMLNESIMCGTPVVSFNIGVALDLVYTGKTGYRAKLKNSLDLSHGIKFILELSESKAQEIRNNCRSLALRKCSTKIQRDEFIDLFRSLLNYSKF